MRRRGARSAVVAARPAAFFPGIVHLRLVDDSVVPSSDDIHEWVDALRADPSVVAIRTSALFPNSADRFEAAGFTVADTLSLLRAELASQPVRAALRTPLANDRDGIATLRRRDYDAASVVDRAAFGDSWGHDVEALDEIRHATPLHRARCRFQRRGLFAREIAAFAVAGASCEHGYLQRLSVDPSQQRRGHGRRLTLNALEWMTRRKLPDCLVNTSVDNAAALALYDSVGFRLMGDRLRVLRCDIRSAV